MTKLVPFSKSIFSMEASASLALEKKSLALEFQVTGPMASLLLKPSRSFGAGPQDSVSGQELTQFQRCDELWKTTCFEAFLQPRQRANYWELNLSSAGQWNVYSMSEYRKNLQLETQVSSLTDFYFHLDNDSLQLRVNWPLDFLSTQSGLFNLGLAAVLETQDGEKSYWALSHHRDRPDFHDAKGFKIEIKSF